MNDDLLPSVAQEKLTGVCVAHVRISAERPACEREISHEVVSIVPARDIGGQLCAAADPHIWQCTRRAALQAQDTFRDVRAAGVQRLSREHHRASSALLQASDADRRVAREAVHREVRRCIARDILHVKRRREQPKPRARAELIVGRSRRAGDRDISRHENAAVRAAMLAEIVHCAALQREIIHTLKARARSVQWIVLPRSCDAECDEVLRRGEEIHRVRRRGNQRRTLCDIQRAARDVCTESVERSIRATGHDKRAAAHLDIPREAVLGSEHEASVACFCEPRRGGVVRDHRSDDECHRAVLENHEVLASRAAQRAAVDCRARSRDRRCHEDAASRQRLPGCDGNRAAFVLVKAQTRHARARRERRIHATRYVGISRQRRSRADRVSANRRQTGEICPTHRLRSPIAIPDRRKRHAAIREDRPRRAAARDDSICRRLRARRQREHRRRADVASDCAEIHREARRAA